MNHFNRGLVKRNQVSKEHSLTPENLIDAYRYACEKQSIKPIESLAKQLEDYNAFNIRGHDLILKNEQLNYKQIEALEEILKRIQFRLIDLEGCNLDEDGATALFEMIEYYESATHLDISGNTNLGLSIRAWEAFNRMLNKTVCLQHLVLKDSDLSDKSCIVIYRALRKGSHLISLNLENSNIQGRSFPGLVSSLKENQTIRELFLGFNFLTEMDAKNIKHLLLNNSTLELLDLHCNELNDDCLRYICEGLAEQPASPGDGLKILNLSSNLITQRGMTYIVQALPFCRNLRAIDLSYNKINNDGLQTLTSGMFEKCSQLVLRLKSCEITCEGACILAECIKKFKRLKQVDMRENDIKNKGFTAIRDALMLNKNITLFELSEPANSDEECLNLLKQIQEICSQNKYNSQIELLNQTTQSIDASEPLFQNQYIINSGDIWNNVSLTSMNGTSTQSSTPRFSLSELFKPIHTLTTTTASITPTLNISNHQSTTPPVPPSTPNNQMSLMSPSANSQQHSINVNALLNNTQTELNINIDDQIKSHMSLDSPNSYLSSSNNSTQSSHLRQYSSSPGSRFKISPSNQADNKFLRSNSINESSCTEDQTMRSTPISTTGSTNKMMRSCSLGSWNSKYDKNERTSRSGRFSISPVISPVPDNEMSNLEFEYMNDKHSNNGRWSANSISESDEYGFSNENDQNQSNLPTNKLSTNIDQRNKSQNICNEILFTITNLDADRQTDVGTSPTCINVQTDEDDRSIGNISLSEDNDFVPELTTVEPAKKLSLLIPDTTNHNKNRRMSTPAMSSTINQQVTKKPRPRIPTLKISPQLSALDLRSSVPLSPTSLCSKVSLSFNPDVEEFLSKFST